MSVYYDKRKQCFVAKRFRHGKTYFLGNHETKDAAETALQEFVTNGFIKADPAHPHPTHDSRFVERTDPMDWLERSRKSMEALSQHPHARKRQC